MICCPVMFVVPALALVDLYISVLYELVLACAGIGQDLAYYDFLTLSVCSGKIAMTSKKSMCWKLITLTPDQQTVVCDLCMADLAYNKRSTTNLLWHFHPGHPFEFAAYEEKQLRPVSMP